MILCRPKIHKAKRIASFTSTNTACLLSFAPNNETFKQKMDQNDILMKVQHVRKNNHFLKRVVKFVISISLLSFVVCYSSGFTPLPHSFNICFSTMLFSIFTRTLERKFMFLVCNGILAFLARSSCSFSSSSRSGSDLDGDGELFRKRDRSASDDLPEDEIKVSASELSEVEAVTAENAATIGDNEYHNLALAAEEEEEEEEKLQVQEKDKEEEDEDDQQGEQMLQETEFTNTGVEEAEGENETWVVEDDDRLTEELEECGYMTKNTELPAVATGNEEMMSTEELNKKFEEFIRKMKEEIRIEAKSQLIAV